MSKTTFGAVYVLIGHRDVEKLTNSVKIFKSFAPNTPVTIYHDIPEEEVLLEDIPGVSFKEFNRVNYPVREENRNSSLYRLVALQESPHDSTLYLDNDIYIVHPGFFEGFKIAHYYGISMVQNPRMFIKTGERNIGDLDIGADVLAYDHKFCNDMPLYMTSYNMGVMFYSKHHGPSKQFLQALVDEQRTNPSRGQAGLYRTIWKTRYAPYCLPINWLVCKKHCGIENPLALHVGHANVEQWWEREFKK